MSQAYVKFKKYFVIFLLLLLTAAKNIYIMSIIEKSIDEKVVTGLVSIQREGSR
ncbi:hypothetical protein SDC9_92169 [bioreactor metagenome]|uniref:Uncharacterized protein n=1 Tax=bioreactor metagenome TaxID=1076179 RepID=A0A644ZXD4_9ZZZZ